METTALHTIKTRLFVILLAANTALAILTYLTISWSFDQGFLDYLNRAERERLEPLIASLAEGFAANGSWQWLTQDRRRWRSLLRRTIFDSRRKAFEEMRHAKHPSPHPEETDKPHRFFPGPGGSFDPRLLLFDANKELLVGPRGPSPPESLVNAILRPIVVKEKTVGYLGLIPRRELVESVEQVFAAQQNRNFAIIAGGMLLTSGLLAIGIAGWLARPIKALTKGTHSLTQGHFDYRLDIAGRDELAQLARDFNRLAETLAANQQTRRQWIADIAHELRTPLTVLNGEIEAMIDGVMAISRENVVALNSEIKQLSRLVADLYELSLSDLGALEYNKQKLSLPDNVQEVLNSHKGALQKAGLELSLTFGENLELEADPQRLAQVWKNLLQNSIRYTESPGKLAIEMARESGQLVVRWQDSPPGVSAADLPRLTERLYRVESSRNRASGGSGLGLAIAHSVIRAHGGRMRASTSLLGGLAWTITLPESRVSQS